MGRKTTWDLLYRSGLSAAIGRRYAGIGSIFAFHRVVPEVSAHLNGDLYVSVQFLEDWLAALHKADVEVISMSDAVERVEDPGRSGRRFVVVTFDDGYADNLVHALPVLERYQAPFTVYVTTALVEGSGSLWWLGLENMLRRNEAVEVPPMERRFTAASIEEKACAIAQVARWVWADIAQRAPMLLDVFKRYGVSLSAETKEAGLSREQLRELSGHPLATIGGHTTDHPDLTSLSPLQASREMSDNKTFLENLCECPVDHFAYPYGVGGAREAGLAGKAGFKTAVTNKQGCLFPDHRDNRMLLPRHLCLGSRMWLSFAHAQRHGARHFIASRGGCPVVAL